MSRKPWPPYLRPVPPAPDGPPPASEREAYLPPPNMLEKLWALDPDLAAAVEAKAEAARKKRMPKVGTALELYYAMYCEDDD